MTEVETISLAKESTNNLLMQASIQSAIENMKCIQFLYEGLPRIAEPHCCGVSSKGNFLFRAYQIGGQSSTGILGWKLFDLNKIENLIILDEYFKVPRHDYKKGDKAMKQIIVEL